jgi:hypothetical protein
VLHAALHSRHAPTSVTLIPGAVKLFRCGTELHDKIAGQVLWLGFTAFFAPEAHECGLVGAHDDARVRAADKRAPRPECM